jgi:hypothetical protein
MTKNLIKVMNRISSHGKTGHPVSLVIVVSEKPFIPSPSFSIPNFGEAITNSLRFMKAQAIITMGT